MALSVLGASIFGCGGGAGDTGPGPGPGPNPGLRGRVVEEGSTIGIASVQVRFYNAGGLVDTLTTDAGGNFAGDIATSATSFHIVSIPLGYHKSYVFDGKRYAPLIPGCRAPLPSLAGGNVTLTAISVPSSSFPPPPPPDGCQ